MPQPDNIDPDNFVFFDIADVRAKVIDAIKAMGLVGKPSSFEAMRMFVLAQLAAPRSTGAMVAVSVRTVTNAGHGSQFQLTITEYDA